MALAFIRDGENLFVTADSPLEKFEIQVEGLRSEELFNQGLQDFVIEVVVDLAAIN